MNWILLFQSIWLVCLVIALVTLCFAWWKLHKAEMKLRKAKMMLDNLIGAVNNSNAELMRVEILMKDASKEIDRLIQEAAKEAAHAQDMLNDANARAAHSQAVSDKLKSHFCDYHLAEKWPIGCILCKYEADARSKY